MSNSYEKLKRKVHLVQEILHFHITISHLLECVYRRLSFRQKFKNPWLIEATERLNCKIYFTNGLKQLRSIQLLSVGRQR